MNNFGQYTFSDGKFYEGFYKKDKKHGWGCYTWSDGKKYLGWWTEGKQDGYGIYVQADGSRKYGLWNAGSKKRWLTDDEIREVQSNRLQQESNPTLSQDEKDRLAFDKPAIFEQKKAEVAAKIKLQGS